MKFHLLHPVNPRRLCLILSEFFGQGLFRLSISLQIEPLSKLTVMNKSMGISVPFQNAKTACAKINRHKRFFPYSLNCFFTDRQKKLADFRFAEESMTCFFPSENSAEKGCGMRDNPWKKAGIHQKHRKNMKEKRGKQDTEKEPGSYSYSFSEIPHDRPSNQKTNELIIPVSPFITEKPRKNDRRSYPEKGRCRSFRLLV